MITVLSVHNELVVCRTEVARAARRAVAAACPDRPRLRHAVTTLLDLDDSRHNIFRLLPVAFTGTAQARLVAVLSRIWWAGAETFDDVNDGAFTGELTATEALIAGTACGSLIPHAVLRDHVADLVLRQRLCDELVASTVDAAEGQLDDVGGGPARWRRVMRCYAGKTGAAYGRDLVMNALLHDEPEERLPAWQAFGRLFGVLRQLVNDRAALSSSDAGDCEDLVNGTRTLLLATAAETHELTRLRERAVHSPQAREELHSVLLDPAVTSVYDGRVRGIRVKLLTLLDVLATVPERRELVRLLVNTSTQDALITRRTDGG